MRVLISGSGIAGNTLAFWLAKLGAQVTVVEKSKVMLTQGQNVDIKGAAVTIAKKMKILDEISKYNTTESGTQFVDSNGRTIASLPLNDGARSLTSPYEILRGDLAMVLFNACKDTSNVKFLFGTTVEKVIDSTVAPDLKNQRDHLHDPNSSDSQSSNVDSKISSNINDNDVVSNENAVQVKLSNGETNQYDFVVAADGQWSKLRKEHFPPPTIIDKDMYVVYYTVPRLEQDNTFWNIYFGLKSRIVTTRPDPHGTIRAMFSCMPCNEAQKVAWQNQIRAGKESQLQLLTEVFADAGWQSKRLLEAGKTSPDFYFQAMQQIKMDQWSKGKMICMGDAAHAPTPLTGQGTTLAMIGAYLLAGELSNLKQGQPVAMAFENYQKKFKPFVDKVQEIPWFVPGFAHPISAGKRWILQTFLRGVAKIAAIPWFSGNSQTAEQQDDGFPCPDYPLLEGKE